MQATGFGHLPAGFSEDWLQGNYGRTRYWHSALRPHTRPPVVLIHGYSALIEFWGAVLPDLAAEYPIYALDLYGFGQSDRLNLPPSKHLWAAQVATFIERVIGEPAIVVGHSLGGTVAAQLAASYPHLVRAVALVGSTGIAHIGHLYRVYQRLFYLGVKTPLVGEVVSLAFGAHITTVQFLRAVYYRRERIRPELVAIFKPTLQRPSDFLFRLDVLRRFNEYGLDLRPGDVSVPVLILWGDHDPAFPLQLAYTFQFRYFPHAEVRLIPESGHCPFDETPEAFCAALLPWLAAQSAQSAQSAQPAAVLPTAMAVATLSPLP